MAIWLTQGDLENAMTIATVAAVFDDANNGQLNQAAIASVIARAEGQVLSYLHEYGPPPFSDAVITQLQGDDMLKDAALQFAIIYTYDRDPAYVRANAKERVDRHKAAVELMVRILDARQRPANVPKVPANVGGVSVDNSPRLYVDSPTSTGGPSPQNQNSGDY